MNRRPSPGVIALLLVVLLACSSTAYAVGKTSGDSLIKKQSLSGNRLKPDTLTGKQVKEGTLATVPRAASADTATTATTATTAKGLVPLTVTPLTLDANWQSSDPTSFPVFMVDSQQIVRLQGAVQLNGSGNLIGTLPVAARPTDPVYATVVTLGFAIGVVGIGTNGQVRLNNGNANFVSLDNISFLAG